ncbi:MAG: hypothetical protein ACI9OJ_001038 [Myxococcota bacterium]|jgi:hypothetical protein
MTTGFGYKSRFDSRLSRTTDGPQTQGKQTVDKQTQTEIEAAVFRRFVAHLQERPDVQNIDLMILGNFCRNCLSKWYRAAAEERGVDVEDATARELIYGMPYSEYKANHQCEQPPEKMEQFANRRRD